MTLSLAEDKILWPGNLNKKPTGMMIPTHLNVLTIVETPFVYARKLTKISGEYGQNDHKRTIGGNLGSFLSGEDAFPGGVAGGVAGGGGGEEWWEEEEDLPAGHCDRQRGEVECPLYSKGRRHSLYF